MNTDGEVDGEGVGWNSIRKDVLERDNRECRFCEITEGEHRSKYGRGLTAHHIIPERDGGPDTLGNLITVCQSCHQTLERTHAKAVFGLEYQRDPADGRDKDGRFLQTQTDTDVLDAVAAHAPAATSEIGEDLGLTRQAADYRLRQLREENRVESKKIGNSLAWFLPDE